MKKVIIYLLCIFSTFVTMASDSLAFTEVSESLALTVHEENTLYKDGKIKSVYQYVNINGPVLHGIYKEFNKDGSISIKGEYSFNRKIKEWKYFDSVGVLINTAFFKENTMEDMDRIHENNENIQKALKEIEGMKKNIQPEPLYETMEKKRYGGNAFGIIGILGGTLGLIFTIVDANAEIGKDSDEKAIKNEWGKIHTVCLSLSITAIFSGISTIYIANK